MADLTELCKIAQKYGTDKYPSYTPFYYELLKDKRESFRKILELGTGCQRKMPHVFEYKSGASLYMWRDFFPKAQIYGADIFTDAMVKNEERIETFLCDERKEKHLLKLLQKTGRDIDLFIDDAYHHPRFQLFLFHTVMPLLKKDVIYIIEDALYLVREPEKFAGYNYQILNTKSAKGIIIKNKI